MDESQSAGLLRFHTLAAKIGFNVALVAGDHRVERVTISTLRELEKLAAARFRKSSASTYRHTGNIVDEIHLAGDGQQVAPRFAQENF
jgi:hypothetical protein